MLGLDDLDRLRRHGDVFCHELAGGGWGDPLERDPQAVLRDVRNEYVSAHAARRDYGVVVDTTNWQVDAPATAQLRARMAAQRPPDDGPVSWSEPAGHAAE